MVPALLAETKLLFRRPSFWIPAALTAALSCAALTVVGSIREVVERRLLPTTRPDRLVWLSYSSMAQSDLGAAPASVRRWAAEHSLLEAAALFTKRSLPVGNGHTATDMGVALVSGSYFRVFPGAAVHGRILTPTDDEDGAPRVALIRQRLWVTLFGAQRDIIGSSVRIGADDFEIVGIVADDFSFPDRDVVAWIPASTLLRPLGTIDGGGVGWSVGRMRPGVTPRVLEARLRVVDRAAATFAGSDSLTVHAIPLRERLLAPIQPQLRLLLAGSVLSCVLALANLGTLFLVDAVRGQHEHAIRLALGAQSRHVVAVGMIRGVVIAGIGAASGLAFSWGLMRASNRIDASQLSEFSRVSISAMNALLGVAATVFGTLLMAALAGGFMGVALRADPRRGLSPDARRATRVRRSFASVQLALSTVFVASAATISWSFWVMSGSRLGFDPRGLTSFTLSSRVVVATPPQLDSLRAFARQIERAATEDPALGPVAISDVAPGAGTQNQSRAGLDGDQPRVTLRLQSVSPSYSRVVGLQLLEGRFIDRDDDDQHPLVAVVTANAATQLGHQPIGHELNLTELGVAVRVVGVVADVAQHGPGEAAPPLAFLAFQQIPMPTVRIVARIPPGATSRIATLSELLARVDATRAIARVQPVESLLDAATFRIRAYALLLGALAAIALAIACAGVYSTMSLQAGLRQREFGIRMGVGATAADVRNLMLAETLSLSVSGVLSGVALTIALSGVLTSALFGAQPVQLTVLLPVSAGVMLVAVAAAIAPARRAGRTDPARVLQAT